MTEPEDPIAEARRLLANHEGEWGIPGTDRAMHVAITISPRLLAALCDRLEANEGETRTAERPDSTS